MYKKLSELSDIEQLLFRNYELTKLMVLEERGKKKKIGNNYGVHLLLGVTLEPFGIQLQHKIKVEDFQFRGMYLSLDFPIENEPILKQLYGYKGK